MTAPTPTPADRFGLRTAGWQALDRFGDASRPALDRVETVPLAVEHLLGTR